MLQSLYIENIAIIEKLHIDFSDGFNVLTGETGAGKSILVDSIGLLLGSKASRELVGTFAKLSRVKGCFCRLDEQAVKVLAQFDIAPDSEGMLWVERKITAEGRSSALVQDVPVSVSTLQSLAPYLINIHGQHDNILLLRAEKHIDFLDAFAEDEQELSAYYTVYESVKEARKELQKLHKDMESREVEVLNLQRELQRFDEVEVSVGLQEELRSKRKILMQQQKIADFLQKTSGCFIGEDSDVLTALHTALGAGEEVRALSSEFAEICEQLETAIAALQPLPAVCQSALEDMEGEESLVKLEDRLYHLEELLKKYGPDEPSALQKRDEMKERLDTLLLTEDRIEKAQEKYLSLLSDLKDKAEKLSICRKEAGQSLCKKMIEQLRYLDMNGVEFSVDMIRSLNAKGGISYTPKGMDKVEFLLSANRGQPPRPLSKIASGGELSRIMLSLTDVLAQKRESSTLIFDEVDVGVSGKTAEKIGRKISAVAKARQVICITHLAQIAALADAHFLIRKSESDGRHITSVRELGTEERIEEVARIIGGVNITDTVRASAKEMIENK